jgi:site-specific DNA recombinase
MPRRKRAQRATKADLAAGARLAAYLRDSGGQGQALSVSQQRAALATYAAERNWRIVAWYVDEAQSAATDDRPAFQDLLAACREDDPGFAAVLTWSGSRFGRDLLDSQFHRADLRRRGIDVVSANPAEAAPDGAMGYIVEALFDWKNEQFLDDMARDVRRGLRANVAAGYAPGGTPPRGYRAEQVAAGVRRDGKPKLVPRWVVDPETGPRVTQAFTLFAGGASYAEIHAATRLYSANSSYVSMLRNRSYLGILKFGAEEFPGALPPLVDLETWDACQARIAAGAAYTPRPGSEYLLSGLTECGYCGSAMSGGVDRRNERRGGHGWRYYKCDRKRRAGLAVCPEQHHVGAELLERRVIAAVVDRILTPEHIAQLWAGLQEELGGGALAAEVAALADRIGGLQRSIANLLNLVEQGSLAAAAAGERLAQRQAELVELEAQRAAKERRQQAFAQALAPEELAVVLTALRAGVIAEEIPVARRALKAFVARVVVKGAELRIDYRADLLLALEQVPPRGLSACASNSLFSLVVPAKQPL